MDLFDYNSETLFNAEKTNFMNYSEIYSFRIYNFNSKNQLKIYDYEENYIKKMNAYYNVSNNKIILLYQCPNKIKYFSFDFQENIFNIPSISQTFELKTYETLNITINEIFSDISDYGNLNIEAVTKNISGNEIIENYGINFSNFLVNNNIFVSEKSFNTWYKYNLSFIEHVENKYTRIYYLEDVNIIINTCYSQNCTSCWENYNKCDNYENGNYALLIDNQTKGYKNDKFILGYYYNETTKYFENCYHSCSFCNSGNQNTHNCLSCKEGYLFSYSKPGNCYKINDLEISEEKSINIEDNETFIKTSCSNNKIISNGECIENCPLTSPFYSFYNDNNLEIYNKNQSLITPKYLFNKICYEECPLDTIKDDTDNVCKCEHAFYIEGEKTICYEETNCPNNFRYQNPDTKECYLSLDDCLNKGNNHFFNKNCYKNDCPNGTIPLSSTNDNIQQYFINNLLLDDNIINKICICNISESVWNNINSNEKYFQECLPECPMGYKSENISNHCIKDKCDIQFEFNDNYYKKYANCRAVYCEECLTECPKDTSLHRMIQN